MQRFCSALAAVSLLLSFVYATCEEGHGFSLTMKMGNFRFVASTCES